MKKYKNIAMEQPDDGAEIYVFEPDTGKEVLRTFSKKHFDITGRIPYAKGVRWRPKNKNHG